MRKIIYCILILLVFVKCQNDKNNNSTDYYNIPYPEKQENGFLKENHYNNNQFSKGVSFALSEMLKKTTGLPLLKYDAFEVYRYSFLYNTGFDYIYRLERSKKNKQIKIYRNGNYLKIVNNDSIWKIINIKLDKSDFWNLKSYGIHNTGDAILFEGKKGDKYNIICRSFPLSDPILYDIICNFENLVK